MTTPVNRRHDQNFIAKISKLFINIRIDENEITKVAQSNLWEYILINILLGLLILINCVRKLPQLLVH